MAGPVQGGVGWVGGVVLALGVAPAITAGVRAPDRRVGSSPGRTGELVGPGELPLAGSRLRRGWVGVSRAAGHEQSAAERGQAKRTRAGAPVCAGHSRSAGAEDADASRSRTPSTVNGDGKPPGRRGVPVRFADPIGPARRTVEAVTRPRQRRSRSAPPTPQPALLMAPPGRCTGPAVAARLR